jgi:hypothetical protein
MPAKPYRAYGRLPAEGRRPPGRARLNRLELRWRICLRGYFFDLRIMALSAGFVS